MPQHPTLIRKRLSLWKPCVWKGTWWFTAATGCWSPDGPPSNPRKSCITAPSCFLLKEGWKVSRFIDHQGNLICWYCDIWPPNMMLLPIPSPLQICWRTYSSTPPV